MGKLKKYEWLINEDTSEYWSDEEEGGHICLFPTKLQTITFRVLGEL